ncbi:hypothetical protein [Chrysiogenes arsenatis]|uniref:hypothetical protein n=1 Tax=Chrysiogenes arsenatis TaxID=309797 RepID=UPI0003FC0844|nr:hypothetical protein [Chrysiogenes arsenatis]
MELYKKNQSTIVITGHIKSIIDAQTIRKSIEDSITQGSRSIHLIIEDSFSMTSAVIGFLLKVVNDGVQISITLSDHRLWKLLNDFQLINVLNVQEKPAIEKHH